MNHIPGFDLLRHESLLAAAFTPRGQLSGTAGGLRMSGPSIFNVEPTSVTLGAVLARGAYGTVLYKADLQQGDRSFPVWLAGNRF